MRILSILLLISFVSIGGQAGINTDSSLSDNKSDRIINHLNQVTDSYVMVAAHRGDWRNAPENVRSPVFASRARDLPHNSKRLLNNIPRI